MIIDNSSDNKPDSVSELKDTVNKEVTEANDRVKSLVKTGIHAFIGVMCATMYVANDKIERLTTKITHPIDISYIESFLKNMKTRMEAEFESLRSTVFASKVIDNGSEKVKFFFMNIKLPDGKVIRRAICLIRPAVSEFLLSFDPYQEGSSVTETVDSSSKEFHVKLIDDRYARIAYNPSTKTITSIEFRVMCNGVDYKCVATEKNIVLKDDDDKIKYAVENGQFKAYADKVLAATPPSRVEVVSSSSGSTSSSKPAIDSQKPSK